MTLPFGSVGAKPGIGWRKLLVFDCDLSNILNNLFDTRIDDA